MRNVESCSHGVRGPPPDEESDGDAWVGGGSQQTRSWMMIGESLPGHSSKPAVCLDLLPGRR